MGVEREVKVPDIGDFQDVDVIEVLVAPGDRVAVEASLVALESDKATMEIPSPFAGVVKEVLVRVGDKVSEGSPIARIDVEEAAEALEPSAAAAATPRGRGESAASGRLPEPATAAQQEPAGPSARTSGARPASGPAPPALARDAGEPRGPADLRPSYGFAAEDLEEAPRGTRGHASPSVRRLARELGVDLARVPPSGPKGRILKEDLQGFVKSVLARRDAGGRADRGRRRRAPRPRSTSRSSARPSSSR